MALKFDPTINLSHILTSFMLLAAGMGGFYSQGNRISILEDRDARAQIINTERQGEAKETLKEIKTDIKELQRGVNEISRAVASRNGAVTNNGGNAR